MACLYETVEHVVSAGIRAYIGLIGRGETRRSGQIFRDALQMSAVVAGGPSSRLPPALSPKGPQADWVCSRSPAVESMVALILKSLLLNLLVLKVTVFWRLIPELEELKNACERVAAALDDQDGPGDPSKNTSGGTGGLNGGGTMMHGTVCGCRRSNALPAVPALSDQSADVAAREARIKTPAPSV